MSTPTELQAMAKLITADEMFYARNFKVGKEPGDELVANLIMLFDERRKLTKERDALRAELESLRNSAGDQTFQDQGEPGPGI